MKHTFDLSVFRNKKTIYIKVSGYHGICKIYDWIPDKKRYQPRMIGLKYYAHKKISGIQKQKCFESFEEAKTWRASNALWSQPNQNESVLFKDVMARFFEERKSQVQISTWEINKIYSKHLTFFLEVPVDQINSYAIDEWLKRIKSPSYLSSQHKTRLYYKHELSLLRLILKFYGEYYCDSYVLPLKQRHIENSIVDHEKLKLAKAKNSTRFIGREAVEKWIETLLAKGQQDSSKMVYGILALFQLSSGVRIGEACALEWSDISLDSNQVCISKSVQWSRSMGRETRISPLTKTGESRVIYIPTQISSALQMWKSISESTGPLIFSLDGNNPVSYRSIQHSYNWAFKKLGMPFSSTHILRHTYATSFLESTRNQLALSRQLGHRSLKQTEHYAKITSTVVSEGVKHYEQVISKPNLYSLESLRAQKNNLMLGEAGKLENNRDNENTNPLNTLLKIKL